MGWVTDLVDLGHHLDGALHEVFVLDVGERVLPQLEFVQVCWGSGWVGAFDGGEEGGLNELL